MSYVYPRRGEPWVECDYCGFDVPKSLVRRDNRGRLACPEDFDSPNRDDYWKRWQGPRPEEGFGEPIPEGSEE